MNNTLKGYATETWVLKQLAKIKPTTVQQTQNTGAPISEFLSKYFEEVEDPENPGTTMWRAKAAKNADTVDNVHILPKDGSASSGATILYEIINDVTQVLKATKADEAEKAKEAEKATKADEADKIDGIHINFGYTKSTYKALVDAGLDDPNTLYLIRKE